MTATETLKHEHRVIELVLGAVDREARKAVKGEPVDPSFFAQAIEFIRTFADKCHHGKEETALFPAMAKAGIPVEQGPIGVMLAEHDEGRRYIRGMGEALEAYKRGEQSARKPLAENARGYASLLAQHIQKEDNILFPMANQVLSDAEQQRLIGEFDRIESEKIGPGVHEHYHQMIDELDPAV